MNDEIRRKVELHSAGATVQHAGPYADLEVPSSMDPVEDLTKWVAPFYNLGFRAADEFSANYLPIRDDVSVELCQTLLISFNWRTRIVAGYFAAIENFIDLEDHIGRLFLRSDVCFAGQGYALALGMFNTPKSIEFLKKYLDHYLSRKDLYFDQLDAMAALHYTDSINGTSNFDDYLKLWKDYISDKPNHDLKKAIKQFKKDIGSAKRIRNSENGGWLAMFARLFSRFK